MIPLKYSVRNLKARWTNTFMIVLGIGLVVWSSCLLFGLVEGLNHLLSVSGDPMGVIVLRKGATDEATAGYAESTADEVMTLNGIARGEGMPLVAKEGVTIPIAERFEGTRTNLIVRGVSAASRHLRPNFTIVAGNYLTPGKGECVVSKSVSRRFKNTAVGSTLKLGEKESYRVVGLFTAGGSAAESEIWVDIGDLARNNNNNGFVSSVRLRAASPSDRDRLIKTLTDDARFRLNAQTETDYYASQSSAGVLFIAGGTLIAIALTFGAMFAAANTMFAAVSARTREIGTLRALGFRRRDILISFMGESLLLCTLGGALGLLATFPLRFLTFSTALNFADASVSFRFGPIVMIVATVMTLAMGLFGGLFPALRAVRLDVVRALREV